MGLRPTKCHENILESLMHLNKWTRVVEVDGAVDKSRPPTCLIRSVRLNEQVRVADSVCGVGGSAKWCLRFFPVRSLPWSGEKRLWNRRTK